MITIVKNLPDLVFTKNVNMVELHDSSYTTDSFDANAFAINMQNPAQWPADGETLIFTFSNVAYTFTFKDAPDDSGEQLITYTAAGSPGAEAYANLLAEAFYLHAEMSKLYQFYYAEVLIPTTKKLLVFKPLSAFLAVPTITGTQPLPNENYFGNPQITINPDYALELGFFKLQSNGYTHVFSLTETAPELIASPPSKGKIRFNAAEVLNNYLGELSKPTNNNAQVEAAMQYDYQLVAYNKNLSTGEYDKGVIIKQGKAIKSGVRHDAYPAYVNNLPTDGRFLTWFETTRMALTWQQNFLYILLNKNFDYLGFSGVLLYRETPDAPTQQLAMGFADHEFNDVKQYDVCRLPAGLTTMQFGGDTPEELWEAFLLTEPTAELVGFTILPITIVDEDIEDALEPYTYWFDIEGRFDRVLSYRNSLGVWEYFPCQGKQQQSLEIKSKAFETREDATTKHTKADIKQRLAFTIETGPMEEQEVKALASILGTKSFWYTYQNGTSFELILKDSTTQIMEDANGNYQLKFTAMEVVENTNYSVV